MRPLPIQGLVLGAFTCAFALIACPGNESQLDPKYNTGGEERSPCNDS